MLKNMTASEIKRMTTDGKTVMWKINKGPGARAGHFPSFFSLFYNAKNPFFRKIHSFSKPVPLPPVRKSWRKWQTDLPETRKCAVSPTKIFTNSLFGLCMHWIGSGSKQHKKRRGKLVLMGPSDAAGGPRWLASAAEELTPWVSFGVFLGVWSLHKIQSDQYFW